MAEEVMHNSEKSILFEISSESLFKWMLTMCPSQVNNIIKNKKQTRKRKISSKSKTLRKRKTSRKRKPKRKTKRKN